MKQQNAICTDGVLLFFTPLYQTLSNRFPHAQSKNI